MTLAEIKIVFSKAEKGIVCCPIIQSTNLLAMSNNSLRIFQPIIIDYQSFIFGTREDYESLLH